jgi:DNA-directed RNA polymerase specialized sigma24 family protein
MDTRFPEFPEYAHTSIEIAARGLVGKGGFTAEDFEDIRSRIKLHTLRHLRRHDPRKAKLSTFVSMVVTDAANHMLRDQFAAKRQHRRAAASLDAPVGQSDEGEDLTMADVLGADEAATGLGYRNRSRHDEAVLRLDVSAVLSQLPDELRECCKAIMDGRTPTEIARKRGIPRRTFRDRVLAPIRRAFKEAGLDARG